MAPLSSFLSCHSEIFIDSILIFVGEKIRGGMLYKT